MQTVRGVYYNLEESTFKYTEDGYTFTFSSDFNLRRFKASIESTKQMTADRLRRNFKGIEFTYENVIPLLQLYLAVEKRGFLVKSDTKTYNNINDFGLIMVKIG